MIRGASGSGKTLLLRTIADLDPADRGQIALRGMTLDSMSAPEWRSRVVYVHPEGARLPGTVASSMSVVANLAVQQEKYVDTSVEGLAPNASTERLSSGESQVLALTRALACNPTALLLDESTSSMDPARAATWESRLVAWVSGGECAIVWVTHEDALAARVGARVVSFP